ncbi:MAG: alpha/beta fold hydrolase [Proteobacteria bacterium]|nr:alpha/beta fold hydrolase [Pseudomonadota bacterium]
MSVSRLALTVVITLAVSGCLRYQAAPMDYEADAGVRSIVTVDGTDVHVAVDGPADAPAVVLVHGFASSLAVWDGVVDDLADDHRVVRLDLPGFGRSSRYPGNYTRSALADTVIAVMDAVGVERADFVGHSMGTAIVLTAASEYPDRVRRAALVSPWLYEDQVPWSLRDARRAGVGEMIFGLWFTEHLDWRFRLAFADPDRWVTEEMVVRARAQLNRPGSRAAALSVVRGLDLPALEERLSEIEAPTLVLQCDGDVVARTEYAERLAGTLPAGLLEPVAGCGHFPMIERAEWFAERMQWWLE